MFLWLYDRLHRRPRLLFILWMGILAVATALAFRIHLKEDIGDFLATDGDVARYMDVFQRIGGQDRIAIIVSLKDTLPPASPSSASPSSVSSSASTSQKASPPTTVTPSQEAPPTSAHLSQKASPPTTVTSSLEAPPTSLPSHDSPHSSFEATVPGAFPPGSSSPLPSALLAFEAALAAVDTAAIITDLRLEVDEDALATVLQQLLAAGPQLMTEDDYRRADSLLSSPSHIATSLAAAREQLSLPTSAFTTPIIRLDPLHLFAPTLDRLAALRQGTDYVIEDGVIITPDRTAAIGFVRSPYASSDSGNNRHLAAILDAACQRLMEQHPGIRVTAIGAPLIAVTNADRIRTDGLIAGTLSVILIALILWFVFRRTSDIIWMVLSIATGYALAIAIVGLYRDELSVIVLGTSSVLIGIAANYPLHFLDHLRHEPDRRRALQDMTPPLLTGNITTVSAFACLAWMDSEAMRDLGIMGTLVLIATIFFVLVFLPVFTKRRHPVHPVDDGMAARPAISPAAPPSPAPGSVGGGMAATRHPLFVLALCAATLVLAYFSLQTSFDTNMQHINYMTPDQRDNLALLGVGLPSSDTGSVLCVSEADNLDDALLSAEAVADSLRAAAMPVRSMQGLMPSRASQEASIARWNRLMTKHATHILAQLPRQAATLGFAKEAFAPFLNLVRTAPQPLPAETFDQVRDLVGAQYITGDANGHTQVITYVTPDVPLTPDAKASWCSRLADKCFLFDSADLQSSLTTTLSDNFNYIGFVCGFVVFAFLWFSFGSIELSMISFLPLAVGWVWILGLMQLFGLQFNIVNIILATFIFGQGDDYTIFITDGLVYEHTYGRRVLRSYRQSVLLSAVIMFVGIGTLIFAQHPAMRSLAEVVIVGMATVVLMAFVLPPIVFRWLTREKGQLREVPLTFERVAITVFASVLYLIVATFYQLFAFLWSHVGPYTERRRLFFHRTLCAISKFSISHIPGTSWSVSNPHGETLERPAIIIANHQSQLDLMAVLSIAPKVVILTKKWVWHNPLYSLILRAAEFYPVSEGLEETNRHVRDLVSRGYSIVVFPEGTRSRDYQLHRFHKGAFEMARDLGIDILPIYLTGLGHVLPKDELAFRRGAMRMEIGQRFSSDDPVLGETTREMTRYFHRLFVQHYADLRRQHERTADVVPYVRYQYKYKERVCEREANRRLTTILSEANRIDSWAEGATCHLPNCGQGELAFVFALVHPDVQVLATDSDPDKIAIARNINIHLPNLRFELQPNSSHQFPSIPSSINPTK